MTSLSFKLDKFEGPLDLLLFLISKHKLNINDIPIAELLEQYLSSIEDMKERDIEVAGEFLEMAAKLIYIKTVSLLPQPNEAEILKKELEGRLIEYSLCKKAAEILKERYCGNSVFVRQPMKIDVDNTYRLLHNPFSLLDIYKSMNLKEMQKKPLLPNEFSKIVSTKIVSVTSKIIFILKKLYTSGKAELGEIFSDITDRSERVATFLAVLELTKSGRILLNDDNSEIYFNRRSTVRKRHLEKLEL
ncbi:MAG TPA: segregation/condensation protein A [Oscillospiraceae bacterium]|nr:segregation/condensation protein A [Oscillospiraceae bacterium]